MFWELMDASSCSWTEMYAASVPEEESLRIRPCVQSAVSANGYRSRSATRNIAQRTLAKLQFLIQDCPIDHAVM